VLLPQRRKTNHGKHDLPSEYVAVRIGEFPNEGLREEPQGCLFCGVCLSSVSNLKSSTRQHVRSESHKKNKVLAAARGTRRMTVRILRRNANKICSFEGRLSPMKRS
jgi:hypothetical protein